MNNINKQKKRLKNTIKLILALVCLVILCTFFIEVEGIGRWQSLASEGETLNDGDYTEEFDDDFYGEDAESGEGNTSIADIYDDFDAKAAAIDEKYSGLEEEYLNEKDKIDDVIKRLETIKKSLNEIIEEAKTYNINADVSEKISEAEKEIKENKSTIGKLTSNISTFESNITKEVNSINERFAREGRPEIHLDVEDIKNRYIDFMIGGGRVSELSDDELEHNFLDGREMAFQDWLLNRYNIDRPQRIFDLEDDLYDWFNAQIEKERLERRNKKLQEDIDGYNKGEYVGIINNIDTINIKKNNMPTIESFDFSNITENSEPSLLKLVEYKGREVSKKLEAINYAVENESKFLTDIENIDELIGRLRNQSNTIQEKIRELHRKWQQELQDLMDERDRKLKELNEKIIEEDDIKAASIAAISTRTRKTKNESIVSYSGSTFFGGELFYENLDDDTYVLCRHFGGTLRRNAKAYWMNIRGEDIEEIEARNGDETVPPVTLEQVSAITYREGFPSSRYIYGECNYNSVGTNNANPMEAYLLAYMDNNDYPGEMQEAWWQTQIIDNDNIFIGVGGLNDMAKQAYEFYKFVQVTGDASRRSGGFNLKKPKWASGQRDIDGTEYNYNKIKITYDEEKNDYTIGPFAIDFTKASYKNVDYGVLDNLLLITDKNQDGVPLKSSNATSWEVMLEDGTITSNVHDIEGKRPFYIILHYGSGVADKKILNVKAQIRYMNGSGKYQKLEGQFSYRKYKVICTQTFPYMYASHYHVEYRIDLNIKNHEGYAGDGQGSFFEDYWPSGGVTAYGRFIDKGNTFPSLCMCESADSSDGYEYIFGPDGAFALIRNNVDSSQDRLYRKHGVSIGSDVIPNELPEGGVDEEVERLNDEWNTANQNDPNAWLDPWMSSGYNDSNIRYISYADCTSCELWDMYRELDKRIGNCTDQVSTDLITEEFWVYAPTSDADDIEGQAWFGDTHGLNKPYICIGLIKYGVEPWQKLNYANSGSLWYEYYELDLLTYYNDSRLSIVKEMTDYNGKKIDTNSIFTLSVDNENSKTLIDYSDYTLVVNSNDGTAVSSRVYYYQNPDGLLFTLKEEPNDNYKCCLEKVVVKDSKGKVIDEISTTNPTGTYLRAVTTETVNGKLSLGAIEGTMPQGDIVLYVTNTIVEYPHKEAKLLIQKVVNSSSTSINGSNAGSSQDNRYTSVEKEFPFIVTIMPGKGSSFFQTNGGTTKAFIDHYVDENTFNQNTSKVLDIIPNVTKGGMHYVTTVKSHEEGKAADESNGQIRNVSVWWTDDDNAPTYVVSELDRNSMEALKKFDNEVQANKTRSPEQKTKFTDLDGNTQNQLKALGITTLEDSLIADNGIFDNDEIYKNIDNTSIVEIENASGTLHGAVRDSSGNIMGSNAVQDVNIIARNERTETHGKLKIRKQLDLSNLISLGFSESQVEEYVEKLISDNKLAFTFDISVEGYETITESMPLSGAIKEGNSYVWELETEEYTFEVGNAPQYTVTEKNNEYTTLTTKNSISGKLEAEKTVVAGSTDGNGYSFTNKLEDNQFGINIEKLFDENLEGELKEQKLHFVVNLDGYFAYYDGNTQILPYGYHKVRLTNNNKSELDKNIISLSDVENSTELSSTANVDDLTEDDKYVTLSPNINAAGIIENNTWSSKTIKYLLTDEESLKVFVSEDTTNLEDNVNSEIIQGVASKEPVRVSDFVDNMEADANGIQKLSVTFKNSKTTTNDKTARLRIRKTLIGVGNLREEEIEKLKFKFSIKVVKRKKGASGASNSWEKVRDSIITIGKESFGNNGWEWIDDNTITWDPEEYDTPIYVVQEITEVLPEYVKFAGISTGGTYKVVQEDDPTDYSLFDNIDKDADKMFNSDVYGTLGDSIGDHYYDNAILLDGIKRVNLERHAAIGLVSPIGKSEAEDENDPNKVLNRGLGTDEYVDTTDIYAENTTGEESLSGVIRVHKEIDSLIDENKQFIPVIKITSGKFEYGGQEYDFEEIKEPLYLSSSNKLVKESDYINLNDSNQENAIILTVEKGSKSSNATWESGTFNWNKGDNPPQYEVENIEYVREITTDPANTLFTEYNGNYVISSDHGSMKREGNIREGEIKGTLDDEISITIKNSGDNTTIYEEISLKLYKEVDISNFSTDKVESLKTESFVFMVNIESVGSTTVETYYNESASRTNTLVFTADPIVRYVEKKDGAKYDYEIHELPNNVGLSLVEAEVENEDTGNLLPIKLTSSNSFISGSLTPNVGATINATNLIAKIINREPSYLENHAKLRINKQNTSKDGTISYSGDVAFTVKIYCDPTSEIGNGMTFATYRNGTEYKELKKGTTYYVSYNNGVETIKEEIDKVHIKFNGDVAKSWTMIGAIYWEEGNRAPRYEILDETVNPPSSTTKVNYRNGDKQIGNLDEEVNEMVTAYIENTTDTADNYVYLKIAKEYAGTLDKVFKFKVDVQGYPTQTITVSSKSGYTMSEPLKFKLGENQDYLEYKITEFDLPAGTKFVGFKESSNGNENTVIGDKTIKGRLTKEKNGSESSALQVTCINDDDGGGPGPHSTSLVLKKAGVNKGNYQFKVRIDAGNELTITGGILAAQLGNGSNANVGFMQENESKLFIVDVGANGEAFLGYFSWIGESTSGPKYTIEEVIDEEGNTVRKNINNPSKTMILGESYVVTQTNQAETTGGYIKVTKKIDTESAQNLHDKNREYVFNVYVYDKNPNEEGANIIHELTGQRVKQNEIWTSDYITWDKEQDAPYYYIVEQTEKDYVTTVSKDNPAQIVEVSKNIPENKIENLEVSDTDSLPYNYNNPNDNDIKIETITNTAEEVSGKFIVKKEVLVEKTGVPNSTFKVIINIDGKFRFNSIPKITRVTYNDKNEKVISTEQYDKIKESDLPIVRDDWTSKEIGLKHGEYIVFDLTWEKGATPPKVTVSETNINALNNPTRQKNGVWSLEGISNNGARLLEGNTLPIVITNRYSRGYGRKLLYRIGGKVWKDAIYKGDKNNVCSNDGVYRSGKGDVGMKNVEVYVYKTADNKQLDLYTDTGTPITQPIYTDANGDWKASINLDSEEDLRKLQFYVVFVYDGQTYEPTSKTFRYCTDTTNNLYETGSLRGENSLIDGSTSVKKRYQQSSLAKDVTASFASRNEIFNKYNRNTADNKLSYIQGRNQMDGRGYTTGEAESNLSTLSVLNYKSDASESRNTNGNTYSTDRVRSKLITTESNGMVKDEFKVAASTINSEFSLTYPFTYSLSLENYDARIENMPLVYKAGYPYSEHINLGLVERDPSDLYIAKDLEKAVVVTNGRKLTYKFNSLAQSLRGNDIIVDQTFDSKYSNDDLSTRCYQIGLFKTDYYYRAELYKTGDAYDRLYEFYKKIGSNISETEMEVFLTYRISVYNASASYDAKIYKIDDYSEESLELVRDEVRRYVKSVNGEENTAKTLETVASANDPLLNGDASDNSLTRSGVGIEYGGSINASDGYTYNKTTFTLPANNSQYTSIPSGEIKEYFMTYRVKKDKNNEGISRAVMLGKTKSNIAEIARYSTLYKDKAVIAGKIDCNSAPANVNIENYNNESRYEDDTYITRANIGFYKDEYNKTISGIAWEDKKGTNSSNGDGLYDEKNEALIGGLTTELVEKLLIPDIDGSGNLSSDAYTEYDFLWPTSEELAVYGGKSYEYLTGFNSTTETARERVKMKSENGRLVLTNDNDNLVVDQKVGEYKFEYIPSGDYVVRVRYGIDKSNKSGTTNVLNSNGTSYARRSGEPTALDDEGKAWNSKNRVAGTFTANYADKRYGQTPAIYNGQDYKTTIYRENGSTSRDNESRRLEVMANSETITNSNGNDMYEANDTDGRHYMIHEFYNMYADSDKVTIYNYQESSNTKDTKDGNYVGKENIVSNTDMTQSENINIGLIERPENRIVLDKQISSIRLTTNDNKLIFNAVYDLSYEVLPKTESLEGKTIIAKMFDGRHIVAVNTLNLDKSTGTDVMQAINKVEDKREDNRYPNTGTQNFRFINLDNDILQGLNVELNYKLVALNVGQEDYTHECIESLSGEKNIADDMLRFAKLIRKENAKFKAASGKINPVNLEYGDREIQNEGHRGIGNYYYTGVKGNYDVPVSTRVRQVMDYVDNDAVFETALNTKKDHYWKNASVKELNGNGDSGSRLIDLLTPNGTTILDKDQRKYVTETQNNLAISVDTVTKKENVTDDNSGFEMKLLPITDGNSDGSSVRTNSVMNIDEAVYKTDYKVASILEITVVKKTSSQDDAKNMSYDNLAEIVMYENSVGRRDMTTVPGDTRPMLGEFVTSLNGRDSSASELVTFTPPTGINYKEVMNNQLIIAVVAGLTILAVGTVIIKKIVIDDGKNKHFK